MMDLSQADAEMNSSITFPHSQNRCFISASPDSR